MIITCDNCGESFRHSDDGEITCTICGVIQQSFSQSVIEEFSSSYTQTQKIGRFKPQEPRVDEAAADDDDESKDFHFILGIQMVLDNLCKALVNSFGFSNQVEVEAKNIWAKYLTFVVENDVPISNMFSNPLTNGSTYYVDSSYMKNTFQVPMDSEKYRIPNRIHKVISDMGKTSFEYATLVCVFRGVQQQSDKIGQDNQVDTKDGKPCNDKGDGTNNPATKKKRLKLYDYTEINAFVEGYEFPSIFQGNIDTGMELPRSRRCSPTGFPIYVLEEMLTWRNIPTCPSLHNDRTYLELSNPYRIAYMMGALYRHDFLWRLLYAYPHLEPLKPFEEFSRRYGVIPQHEILPMIVEHPLELTVVSNIADKLGVVHNPEYNGQTRYSARRLRIELINKIFVHIVDNNFQGHKIADMLSLKISWTVPKMDLQLVCSIIFLALLKCRYPVVVSDIIRWVIQGRIPLRSTACLLPDRILRAAFRPARLAPRMKLASTQQEEVAHNLFTNTSAPNTLGFLEMTTSRLLLSGIFGNREEVSNANFMNYNVHGLCRRISHHLRLPNQVLPVADMIVDSVMHLEEETAQYEPFQHRDYKRSTIRRLGVIYGSCFGGCPLHVFAAACVIAACRMLWPVFHYDAPAYPTHKVRKNEPESEEDLKDKGRKGDDKTDETYIIKRDRFPHCIEFDSARMMWIVRVPVNFSNVASGPIHDKIKQHDGLDQNLLLPFTNLFGQPLRIHPMASILAQGAKEAMDNDIFKSLCETILEKKEVKMPPFLERPDFTTEGEINRTCFFDAKCKGYSKAGINALLWLVFHQPSDAINACSRYILGYDTLSLRHMSFLHIVKSRPYEMLKHLARRYDHLRYFNKVHPKILELVQGIDPNKLLLNMNGYWSGSIVNCIGFNKETFYNAIEVAKGTNKDGNTNSHEAVDTKHDYKISISAISAFLDAKDATKDLTASMPGNRWVYHTLAELFNGYAYYSGWSPEKSLELECYRGLIPNQREQVLEGVKEMLATKLAGEESSAWSHLLQELDTELQCKTDETTSWINALNDPSDRYVHGEEVEGSPNPIENAYTGLKDHVESAFQDLGLLTSTGRQLPPNPWKDYDSLRADLPMAYLMALKSASSFISVPHIMVHSCVCQIEKVLIHINNLNG